MGSLTRHPQSQNHAISGDVSAAQRPRPDLELAVDMDGKVVFVTVQGIREVSKVSAGYLRGRAKLAVLDVSEWALHILSPQPDGSPVEPISCPSWVAAAEAAIAHLGPVDLWMDTRGTIFPPVNRGGNIR